MILLKIKSEIFDARGQPYSSIDNEIFRVPPEISHFPEFIGKYFLRANLNYKHRHDRYALDSLVSAIRTYVRKAIEEQKLDDTQNQRSCETCEYMRKNGILEAFNPYEGEADD